MKLKLRQQAVTLGPAAGGFPLPIQARKQIDLPGESAAAMFFERRRGTERTQRKPNWAVFEPFSSVA